MLALFTLLSLQAGAPAARGTTCPSTAALSAELERLGTGQAVAAVGTPEIRISGRRMHVGLRGIDGVLSGVREVVAPAKCAERAVVAAVLLSAWVGAWPAGSFPEVAPSVSGTDHTGPTPRRSSAAGEEQSDPAPLPTAPRPAGARTKAAPQASLSPPPAPSALTPAAPTPAPAPQPATPPPSWAESTTSKPPMQDQERGSPPDSPSLPQATLARAPLTASSGLPLSGELGGFGFGLYDGDAMGVGAGLHAGLRLPGWLGIDAVFTGSSKRERPMVHGTAAYRLFSLGVGLAVRKAWRPLFVDLGLMPEATLLTVDGKDLQTGSSVARWGLAAAARARLGLLAGSWRPFVLVGVSTALRAERLLLDDYPEQGTTLSRWNLSCGLGLAHVL